jgi:hypothetical protein
MPRKAIPHSAPVRAKGKPVQARPDPQALEDEIHMLRKLMRRAQQAAEQVDLDDVQSMARLLNALSSAAARLAVLLKTQQMLGADQVDEVAAALQLALFELENEQHTARPS